MKFLKIWAAVALLIAVSAVSFYAGREYESYYYNVDNLFEVHQELKDSCQRVYNNACRMAGLIKCYEDHLYNDSIIQDYGCFEELEGIFLYDDALGELINLDDYDTSNYL